MSDIEVVSYKKDVERATEKAVKKAVTMIGGTVEGHAKEMCPVDTGLLRNSITYALGGEAPAITDYASDDGSREGHYEGTAPDDEDNQMTVYVGSNVEYAPYQELGTQKMDARPFLRPAFEGFRGEIEQIIEKCFGEIR